MTQWTRKKRRHPRANGEPIWDVLRDGQVVGCVYRQDQTKLGDMHGELWFFAVQVAPALSGYVETMEEALDRVKAAASDRF